MSTCFACNTDTGGSWIQCSKCNCWYHFKCCGLEGFTENAAKKLMAWKCILCFELRTNMFNMFMEKHCDTNRKVLAGIEQTQSYRVSTDSKLASLTEVVTKLADKVATLEDLIKTVSENNMANTWAQVVHGGIDNNDLHSVVKNSVKSAFQIEKNKSEIIISRLIETENDLKTVSDIGKNMGTQADPILAQRLGLKKDSSRLLEVTFSNEADAKQFRNSFMDARSYIPSLPSISIRRNLSVEERSLYRSRSQHVYNLNREARDNGGAVSYLERR